MTKNNNNLSNHIFVNKPGIGIIFINNYKYMQ